MVSSPQRVLTAGTVTAVMGHARANVRTTNATFPAARAYIVTVALLCPIVQVGAHLAISIKRADFVNVCDFM